MKTISYKGAFYVEAGKKKWPKKCSKCGKRHYPIERCRPTSKKK